MAASTVVLRNLTAAPITFPNLGVTAPALGNVTLTPGALLSEVFDDPDIQDQIDLGNVVLNNGTVDINITDVFTNLFEDPTPSSSLEDADSDTSIQVELAADDDIIRFNVGDSPGPGPFTNVLTIDSLNGFSFNVAAEDLNFQVFGDDPSDALFQLDAASSIIGLGRTSGSTLDVAATAAFVQVRPIGGSRSGAISLEPFAAGAGNTSELRFSELASTNYVGFKAPDLVPSNQIWVLPDADGSAGDSIVTDGAGNLSFGSGTVDLQTAYDNGEIIAITDADGPVEINDGPLTVGSTLLRIDKDFASGDDAVTIDVGAASTGSGLRITQATAGQSSVVVDDVNSNFGGTTFAPDDITFDQDFTITGFTLPVDTGLGYFLFVQAGDGADGSALGAGPGGNLELRSGDGGAGVAAVAGANAGAINLISGNGGASGVGAGGPGGPLNIVAGDGGGGGILGAGGVVSIFGGAGSQGGNNTNTGGQSIDPGFQGGFCAIFGGPAGAAGAGGPVGIIGGPGGPDAGASAGDGGGAFVLAGAGSASAGAGAGDGGAVIIRSGVGGIGDVVNPGGNGGTIFAQSAPGTAAVAGGTPGAGGGFSVQTGPGGGGSAAAAGGDGGDIELFAGPGGADGGAGAGNPGNVNITTPGTLSNVGIGVLAIPGATESRVQITPDTTQAGAITLNPYNVLSGQTSELRFRELAANGISHVGFKAPDSVAADVVWALPDQDGSSGDALITDGAGNLRFVSFAARLANYYDSAGGLTINTTGVALNYDTIRIQDVDYTIAGNNQITFNSPGRYEVTASTTCRFLAGGTRGSFNTVLELDTGSGFTAVPGTVAGGYVRAGGGGNQSCALSTAIVTVTTGDILRVFCQQVVGTSSATIPNGSSLTIKKLGG